MRAYTTSTKTGLMVIGLLLNCLLDDLSVAELCNV